MATQCYANLSYDEWKNKKCAETNPGACAFCVFYAGRKDCGCTPSSKQTTKETKTDVACFENLKSAEDKLCILRDFDKANTHLLNQVNNTHRDATRATMKMFFEQAFETTMVREIMKVTSKVCFHKPGHLTVPWTHAHFYSIRDFPNGPDEGGMDETNSWCTWLTGTASEVALAILELPLKKGVLLGKAWPTTTTTPTTVAPASTAEPVGGPIFYAPISVAGVALLSFFAWLRCRRRPPPHRSHSD